MGVKIDLKAIGLATVQRRMLERSIRMKNMRPANLAAITEIRKWVDNNFQKEGRLHENGKLAWKPLSKFTLEKRRKGKKNGTKILQDTGRLKNSFELSATNKQGTLLNRVNYAVKHEKGFGRIPQRKIFPEMKQAEKIVKPVYDHFLNKKIVKVE